ncbi:MAG: hypothetical protein ACFB02_20935 [Mastigocoleus sp.]
MSTHTFDNHYVTCPICQKNTNHKPIKSCIGLYSCPYCQERIVVCKSGHYVRDPFILRQMIISSELRRQSRPLARIFRDFTLFKGSLLFIVVVILVFAGFFGTTGQSINDINPNQPKPEKKQ